jgi:hypothetical protein
VIRSGFLATLDQLLTDHLAEIGLGHTDALEFGEADGVLPAVPGIRLLLSPPEQPQGGGHTGRVVR